VTITGQPGSWHFAASKSGYQTNTWDQSITTTGQRDAFLYKEAPADITLTLYVHEGSTSGPKLSGARVAGHDGAGNHFDKTTNSSGYVTITGQPGSWHFAASKSGYESNIWDQSITSTCTKHAFLIEQAPADVTLTLYVHEGSSSGPKLSGVRVQGYDGSGSSFDKSTNSSGYVTITGQPGSWHFAASKSGYQTNTWDQSITSTTTKHAYLQPLPNQAPTCSLSASPRSGTAPLAVTFSMSASDPDGSVSAWLLDVDGDGNADFSGNGAPPSTRSYTYTSPGNYSARLVVSDDDGASDLDTETVNVGSENQPPSCSLSASPRSGSAPLTVTFSMSASDPDGVVSPWVLDPGDGSPSYSGSGAPPSTKTHTYNASGTYTAILMVSDNDDATASDAETIVVTSADVTLTLYVHEGSSSGPKLSGARVAGHDGAGNHFDKTSNSSGYVTITGNSGSWHFAASKSGYETNIWDQSITTTCTKHAYLIKPPPADITLTLYVHEGSSSGPKLSGARVAGHDGAGNHFDKTSNSSGYVTITGQPGSWHFAASKSGYETNIWDQSITTTCTKHAFLIR